MKFTNHKINHFKVNKSVAFSTFTLLCHCFLCLVPKHFITPKGNPVTTFFSPVPGNHQSAVCLYELPFLDILYKYVYKYIYKYVTFCVLLLLLSILLSRFIHVVVRIISTSFLRLNCMNTPHLIYTFINCWTFGLFPPFSCCEDYYCEYSCRCFCVNMFSISLGMYLGMELMGHRVTLCLTF